jgi:hypothetical protein
LLGKLGDLPGVFDVGRIGQQYHTVDALGLETGECALVFLRSSCIDHPRLQT